MTGAFRGPPLVLGVTSGVPGGQAGPIAAHSLLVFLLQVGLLLALALLLGRLAMRFGMPTVVGELLVGVILGPSFLARLAPGLHAWLFPPDPGQLHLLDAVGSIGVLLLVGLTGAHMDTGLIRRRGAAAAGVSAGGLIVPLGLGIGAGLLLPRSLAGEGTDPLVFALFLGTSLCVSAIPVIAKTLLDMRLLHRDVGQLLLIAGMIDDAFGWFMLSIVSAMAAGAVTAGTVPAALLRLLAVAVFALTVGRPLVRGALRLAGGPQDPGPRAATVVVLILLAAAGTHALDLEAVLGAFVCGLLICSSGEAGRAGLAPVNTIVLSVLSPIFFATAGLRIDLTALARPAVLLSALAVLAAAVAGKFLGAYAGARLSGLGRWEAVSVGAGLNARGVIEIVVAMTGLRLGILSGEAYTIVVLVAIVTSLMAPPVLRVAVARIRQTAEERAREEEGRIRAA
ncbi:cation:proton antiporter [Planomonospora corallina]|uniref:Cation:proton antiporter n=1 Tax=Planomonospora corallina TaxID=1806052 RepID=A0ABV8HYQ0_9ACTN